VCKLLNLVSDIVYLIHSQLTKQVETVGSLGVCRPSLTVKHIVLASSEKG